MPEGGVPCRPLLGLRIFCRVKWSRVAWSGFPFKWHIWTVVLRLRTTAGRDENNEISLEANKIIQVRKGSVLDQVVIGG